MRQDGFMSGGTAWFGLLGARAAREVKTSSYAAWGAFDCRNGLRVGWHG